jgi:hypothetical protein
VAHTPEDALRSADCVGQRIVLIHTYLAPMSTQGHHAE